MCAMPLYKQAVPIQNTRPQVEIFREKESARAPAHFYWGMPC